MGSVLARALLFHEEDQATSSHTQERRHEEQPASFDRVFILRGTHMNGIRKKLAQSQLHESKLISIFRMQAFAKRHQSRRRFNQGLRKCCSISVHHFHINIKATFELVQEKAHVLLSRVLHGLFTQLLHDRRPLQLISNVARFRKLVTFLRHQVGHLP
jgi:hypothetical protein